MGALVAGRFRIEVFLGSGGAGDVYRVTDESDGAVRALKVLHADLIDAQTAREVRILARLRHPGCVRVHDFGADPAFGPYLVMDLVEGPQPGEVVPAGGGAEAILLAKKILEVLAHLHAHGVVHGDLKPENVRCQAGDPGQPVLLDFGLAAAGIVDGGTWGGTLQYIAPEVLRRQARDARSDLYSLGAMLYELITGQPPFVGTTMTEIVRGHLSGRVRQLDLVAPSVDPGLARFVHRLLRKAPGERPASAGDALAELAELTGDDFMAPSEPVRAELLVGVPVLAGREAVVDTFDTHLSRTTSGEPGLVMVAGPPGSGRTRLLDEMAVRARLASAEVVRWDPAIFRAGPSAVAASMGPLVSGREAGVGDGDASALLAILREAATSSPVVVLVDDVSASEPHLASLVVDTARGLGGVGCLMVVAVEATSDIELGDDLPIEVESLLLPPLDRSALARIVTTSLGEVTDGEALVSWLERQSAGNAAVAVATIRWLVASGHLAHRRGHWYATGDLEAIGDSAGTLTERLASRRLDAVDAGVRAALRVAATLGESFDVSVVAAATGEDLLDEETVSGLVQSHVVRVQRDARWPLRFAQPAMVRMLRDELAADARKAVHTALITALVGAAGGEDADTLADAGLLDTMAHQKIGAGDWAGGAELALRAAATDRAHIEFARTRDLLRTALDAANGSARGDAMQSQLTTALGDLQRRAGYLEDALACYQRALDAAGQRSLGPIRLRLGATRIHAGDYEAGIPLLQTVVDDDSAEAGDRFEAAHDLSWVLAVRDRVDDATSMIDRAASWAADDRRRARRLRQKANILWMVRRPADSLKVNRQALGLFTRLGDEAGCANCELAMGSALRHLHRYQEAEVAYLEALRRFENLGMARKVGKCQNNLAIVHYFRGEFRQATERWEGFLRVLDRTGERVERANLLNNLGSLYRERGLFARAEQLFREGIGLAQTIEVPRLEAMLQGNLGENLARAGKHDEAATALVRTLELARQVGARDEEGEALRRQLENQSLRDPSALSADAIAAARAHADAHKLSLEVANLWRLESVRLRTAGEVDGATEAVARGIQVVDGLGAALEEARLQHELGLVRAAAGDHVAARSALVTVLETFRRMDAGWDMARAAADLRVANRPREEASPLAAIHLQALTAFARRIGTVDDIDAFLRLAMKEIVRLARASRGFVVIYGPGGRPSHKAVTLAEEVAPDHSDVAFSRSITDDVLRTREYVLIPVASADDRYRESESVHALGLRTVLALPVPAAGGVRGVLYLDSRVPCDANLTGSVSFLEGIASIIGATLVQAERLAMERDRAESMAMVVHELKAPLTAIYCYVQMLRMDVDELPEQTGQDLQAVASELGRLNRMVSDLNKIARLQHHHSLHAATPVDMAELIETVVRGLRGMWEAKDLNVHLDLMTPLPPVFGSHDQLVQVITNLLGNAVKFTPAGGRIRVAARGMDAPHTMPGDVGPVLPLTSMDFEDTAISSTGALEVRVEDSGNGIPDDAIETIFSKFSQAGAQKQRMQGMGMGLTIARLIVERHGGRIRAGNLPEGGAVFRFTLPVIDEGFVE